MASDKDLEERTVFAEPEEGGTIAASTPPTGQTHQTHQTQDTQPAPAPERHVELDQNEDLLSRTGYAAEGTRIAVLFAHRFGRRLIGTRAHLTVKLNEPGVSTESGVKARQSIVLVPKGKGRGTTVVGWLDVPRCLAELRSYALLADQYRTRHREEIDVGREEYEAVLNDLQQFLRGSGITPTIAEPPSILPKSGTSSPAKRAEVHVGTRAIAAIIALILMIGIGIGVVVTRSCGSRTSDDLTIEESTAPPSPQVPPKRRLSPLRPR